MTYITIQLKTLFSYILLLLLLMNPVNLNQFHSPFIIFTVYLKVKHSINIYTHTKYTYKNTIIVKQLSKFIYKYLTPRGVGLTVLNYFMPITMFTITTKLPCLNNIQIYTLINVHLEIRIVCVFVFVYTKYVQTELYCVQQSTSTFQLCYRVCMHRVLLVSKLEGLVIQIIQFCLTKTIHSIYKITAHPQQQQH